jgi:hypothetical protein
MEYVGHEVGSVSKVDQSEEEHCRLCFSLVLEERADQDPDVLWLPEWAGPFPSNVFVHLLHGLLEVVSDVVSGLLSLFAIGLADRGPRLAGAQSMDACHWTGSTHFSEDRLLAESQRL